jgi:hypothetical protein
MASSLTMTAEAPQAWDCWLAEGALWQRGQAIPVPRTDEVVYRLQHLGLNLLSRGFVRLTGPLIRGTSQNFQIDTMPPAPKQV